MIKKKKIRTSSNPLVSKPLLLQGTKAITQPHAWEKHLSREWDLLTQFLSTSHTKHPAPTSSHPKLNSVCWVTGMQALLAGSKQAATNTYSSVEGTETGEKHTESAHLYPSPGFLRSHITIIRNPFLPHCLAVATAPTSFCGGKAEATTDPPGAAATGLTLYSPL